mmetsp:Transcript_7161/g.16291  ORF Transcript_7161/g.16291 Transcript_7161/m.16291 type:complete len:295 (-) Transcript_7161:2784-3668(-)
MYIISSRCFGSKFSPPRCYYFFALLLVLRRVPTDTDSSAFFVLVPPLVLCPEATLLSSSTSSAFFGLPSLRLGTVSSTSRTFFPGFDFVLVLLLFLDASDTVEASSSSAAASALRLPRRLDLEAMDASSLATDSSSFFVRRVLLLDLVDFVVDASSDFIFASVAPVVSSTVEPSTISPSGTTGKVGEFLPPLLRVVTMEVGTPGDGPRLVSVSGVKCCSCTDSPSISYSSAGWLSALMGVSATFGEGFLPRFDVLEDTLADRFLELLDAALDLDAVPPCSSKRVPLPSFKFGYK